MALIIELTEVTKERQGVHAPVECAYSIFTGIDGQRYLQLETFGTKDRKTQAKASQSIQLNKSSAAALRRLIERTFPTI